MAKATFVFTVVYDETKLTEEQLEELVATAVHEMEGPLNSRSQKAVTEVDDAEMLEPPDRWVIYDYDQDELIEVAYTNRDAAVEDAGQLNNTIVLGLRTGMARSVAVTGQEGEDDDVAEEG